MPLYPLADAMSAGVLPEGKSGVGSVKAPGAAPSATTVRSLPQNAAQWSAVHP
uniref:Uncharacterized protein n=1 Tax=Arundo donax TaxID=35708 RepID=A0A0A9E764_ARUDO